MRLPMSKVYRAFPELDRFTDFDCERYVRRAQLQGPLIPIAVIAATLATAALLGFLCLRVLMPVADALGWRGTGIEDFDSVIGCTLVVLLSFMAGFVARDALLIRMIRVCIATARCPGCSYSLLGLPVSDGVVLCPECGSSVHLATHGLTPADILSPTA